MTEAAEKAKIELSSVAQTSISLPFITATADGPKHIESQMSRAKFESICSDLLDRCRIPVEQALKDAKLKSSDLSEVSRFLEYKSLSIVRWCLKVACCAPPYLFNLLLCKICSSGDGCRCDGCRCEDCNCAVLFAKLVCVPVT